MLEGVDGVAVVEGSIQQIASEDKHDLVAGLAVANEEILQHGHLMHVDDFGTEFYAELARQCVGGTFTWFDTAAERAVIAIALSIVLALKDEQVLAPADDGNGNDSDARRLYRLGRWHPRNRNAVRCSRHCQSGPCSDRTAHPSDAYERVSLYGFEDYLTASTWNRFPVRQVL